MLTKQGLTKVLFIPGVSTAVQRTQAERALAALL